MTRQHARLKALATRCVFPRRVREERRAPRLIQRRPNLNPVAEDAVDLHCVVTETFCGVAAGPPPLILKRLRQIPVVEGQPRLDVRPEQLVDKARIELDALPVAVHAIRLNARPRNRKAVAL